MEVASSEQQTYFSLHLQAVRLTKSEQTPVLLNEIVRAILLHHTIGWCPLVLWHTSICMYCVCLVPSAQVCMAPMLSTRWCHSGPHQFMLMDSINNWQEEGASKYQDVS